MKLEFRALTADEVECRVGVCKQNGLSLLLYKDARADMKLLDETVGAMNWQRYHSRDNANCTISIWDEDKKQWVSKEDTGTESNTEKEKGLASDSFKRAGTNWGIGRELYTAPFIWVSSLDCDIKPKDGGKGYTTYDKFEVTAMEVDKGVIVGLVIRNVDKNRIVFTLGSAKPKNDNTKTKDYNKKSEDYNKKSEDDNKTFEDDNKTFEDGTVVDIDEAKAKKMKQLWATANECDRTSTEIHKFIKNGFKKDSVKDLTIAEMDFVIAKMKGSANKDE